MYAANIERDSEVSYQPSNIAEVYDANTSLPGPSRVARHVNEGWRREMPQVGSHMSQQRAKTLRLQYLLHAGFHDVLTQHGHEEKI